MRAATEYIEAVGTSETSKGVTYYVAAKSGARYETADFLTARRADFALRLGQPVRIAYSLRAYGQRAIKTLDALPKAEG